jgi:hypothetical protein
MNNEVLHYATPLMRTLNLIHQQNILDHPPLYPWDSNVTMDFGRGASLISMDDVLKKTKEIFCDGDDNREAFAAPGRDMRRSINILVENSPTDKANSLKDFDN